MNLLVKPEQSFWAHTGRFVIIRRIEATNRPYRIVCRHYMRAPAVVWSAVLAISGYRQDHDVELERHQDIARLCVHTTHRC